LPVNTSVQTLEADIRVGQLPDIGKPYWVQCERFRCVAIFNKKGKWIIFPTGEELTSTVYSFWQ
jgi:hypothetical protein